MSKTRFLALILLPFLVYAIFFNVRLFQSNEAIKKSTQLLKDFDFDRAISKAEEAIKLDSLNAEAQLNQAYIQSILWIFRKEKIYQEKMELAFKNAFQLNPKAAVYRYKRASVYADAGDYTKALQHIEEAIKLDPYAAAYWNEKGLYLEMSGQTKAAIVAYQKAFDFSKRQDVQSNVNRLKEQSP